MHCQSLRTISHHICGWQAIQYYQRSTELNPNQAATWSNLGALHANSGRLDEAIAALHRSLQLDPESHGALRNLADAFTSQSTPESLIAAKETLLKIYHSSGDVAILIRRMLVEPTIMHSIEGILRARHELLTNLGSVLSLNAP